MQNLTFRFSGLRRPFTLVTSNETLYDNKPALLSNLLSHDSALEELIKIIQVSNNSSQFSNSEKSILSLIAEKIQKKLEFVEDDETYEKTSKKSELSSQETFILSNSIEFIIAGQIVSNSDEGIKLSDLKNLDKNTITMMTFNFRSGFDFVYPKEQENSSTERKEEADDKKFEVPEFFRCKTHKNTPFTHFCKKCNKLVCAFDFVNSEKEKAKNSCSENCTTHIDEVFTLEHYQIELEVEINKEIEMRDAINKEINEANQALDEETGELLEKKKKNLENFEKNKRKHIEIQNILSIQNQNLSDEINYCKLEEMMKFQIFHNKSALIVEKNEKIGKLQEEIHKKAGEMEKKEREHIQEMNKMRDMMEKETNSLKKQNEEFKKDSNLLKKQHEEQKKQISLFEHKNSKLQELFKNSMSEYQEKKKKNFKVAILATETDEKYIEDVTKNLSKLNRNGMTLTCVITKNITEPDAKSFIQNQDWTDIDTIFHWNNPSGDYSWFGDFLLQQLKKGKGIVLCHFCTEKNYLRGGILSEISFTPGEDKRNDGPKSLVKCIPNHPVLKDVQTFNGGTSSYRALIKAEAGIDINEKVEVVSTWNDDGNTPLIITKSYSGGEKKNYGNLVILNFFPVSSECDSCWRDSKTDGDKIMQNAVTWAAEEWDPEIRKCFQENETITQFKLTNTFKKIKEILD